MRIYEPNIDVTVRLSFKDGDGEQVTPTALDYLVLDETGAEVVALTNIAVFDATKGEHEITVQDTDNDIGSAINGLRKVEMLITTATDQFKVRESYILEIESTLQSEVNSFQTYEESLLVARTLGPMKGWDTATDQHRKSALMQSFDHIGSFHYQFLFSDDTQATGAIRDLEADEWAILQADQLNNFRKAQVIHADYLLGGKKIEREIEEGLQSSTIGEVSQFYRPRASLVLPVSRDAVKYIGKYILWSPRIGRA